MQSRAAGGNEGGQEGGQVAARRGTWDVGRRATSSSRLAAVLWQRANRAHPGRTARRRLTCTLQTEAGRRTRQRPAGQSGARCEPERRRRAQRRGITVALAAMGAGTSSAAGDEPMRAVWRRGGSSNRAARRRAKRCVGGGQASRGSRESRETSRATRRPFQDSNIIVRSRCRGHGSRMLASGRAVRASKLASKISGAGESSQSSYHADGPISATTPSATTPTANTPTAAIDSLIPTDADADRRRHTQPPTWTRMQCQSTPRQLC